MVPNQGGSDQYSPSYRLLQCNDCWHCFRLVFVVWKPLSDTLSINMN